MLDMNAVRTRWADGLGFRLMLSVKGWPSFVTCKSACRRSESRQPPLKQVKQTSTPSEESYVPRRVSLTAVVMGQILPDCQSIACILLDELAQIIAEAAASSAAKYEGTTWW